MQKQALGMIETYGYVAAIEAADACLKAANVSLIHCEKVTGGLITIKITGDVGAVQAAVQAGGIAAARVGKLLSTHVIPRPAFEIEWFLSSGTKEEGMSKNLISNMYKTEEELQAMKVVDLRALARQLPGVSLEKQEIKFARKDELIEAILAFFKRGKT